MATRRYSKRSVSKRSVPYDMNNINNWYAEQFRTKLAEWNIYAPSSYSKSELKSLYLENLSQRSRPEPSENVTISDTSLPVGDKDLDSIVVTPLQSMDIVSDSNMAVTASCADTDRNASEAQHVVAINSPENKDVHSSGKDDINQIYNFMNTMTTLLGKIVDKKESHDISQATLDKFQNQNGNYQNSVSSPGLYGLHPESVGHIDYVTDSIRNKIIEGKYVNLATLLIPEYELLKESKAMRDPRLNRNLTIEEFIIAFQKYKRIHCSRYPWRQMELDKYETNLVEMSRMYGQKFYEYHKIFSQRCAAALAIGKKINWAEKDKDLLQMIIGGTPANACGICGEVSHTTPFCPRHMHPSNKYQDSHGSSKINEIMHNGVPVCHYFNSSGCKRTQCFYAHICKKCKSSSHGVRSCSGSNLKQITVQVSNNSVKPKQSTKNN